MTVKELIEYLNRCNPEFVVTCAETGEEIISIEEYRNFTDPTANRVEIC